MLCQAVATTEQDLVVVGNGYQICEVIQTSKRAKNDLLVVYNSYQVRGAVPSIKEGPACGL